MTPEMRQKVIQRITEMWDNEWMPEELGLDLSDVPYVENAGLYGMLLDLGGDVSDISCPY